MVISLSANDIRAVANWPFLIEALRQGHRLARADIGDTFVHARGNTMLVRSAWIDGLAAGVKAATVVPQNAKRSLPSIHAQIMLFDDEMGALSALVDGTEVTAWKTAADSALGCDLLAPKDVDTFLMIGAGAMAEPLIRAHLSVRPCISNILLWNRTTAKAHDLATRLADLPQSVAVVDDLIDAIPQADIISCATMSAEPVLAGAKVTPGTHVDLVGAYRADMREADDDLHRAGRWFVDSYDTTLDHIGEFTIPVQAGVIQREAVQGDLHELVAGNAGRGHEDEITVFKNGGGAHLDIMVASALVEEFRTRSDVSESGADA
ncbi:MAG: ornithine cyclodeaminase [Ahrensia sp.]|nr:ornithine cyclodeaminase [Ahrensia sp.]